MAAGAPPAETPAVMPDSSTPGVPHIVTPDEAAAARYGADNAISRQYEVVKLLFEGTWLVRRRDDPEARFLSFPDDLNETAPQLAALMDRGARWAFEALLNHQNLICPADTIRWDPLLVNNDLGATPRNLMLWDYCDAGSLRGFMDKTKVPVHVDPETNMVSKWLPESLCWHVVTSVLKALAWLHEGYREEDTIEEGRNGRPTRGARADTRQDRGEDWLSVLHRDVSTHNIYFQQPRATERYGLCKLGNYAKVFVSGHVNDCSAGQVVCSEDGSEQDIYNMTKTNRLDFKGTDVYHLGEVLHMMMTREECAARPLSYPFDVEALLLRLEKGYSRELAGVLRKLLSHHRASVDTAALWIDVKERYLRWKEETPEGQRHRDSWDDMVSRNEDAKKKQAEIRKKAQAQSAPGAADAVGYVQQECC